MAENVASASPAAVLTIGTELTSGLRSDTNAAEIARMLTARGYSVGEIVSVPDDLVAIQEAITRLVGTNALVVATGGLGPTHDDLTREAASRSLGLPLVRDEDIAEGLAGWAARHSHPRSAEQVLRQALVLDGAEIIAPYAGTAPGQAVPTELGTLLLLPGPPDEMRPMLESWLARFAPSLPPVVLRCSGISESDAQVLVEDALAGVSGFGLTVLAKPGDVQVVLSDAGAGPDGLASAAEAAAGALGGRCFSSDGASLAEVVLRELAARRATLAAAESCTGGLVAAELTAVPGSSETFLGGVVAYADSAKRELLGVRKETLTKYGAVSRHTAAEMATGAAARFGADMAIAITGIAGPGGGTAAKPVGTVWFALATGKDVITESRRFPGVRPLVRARASATALDLVRLHLRRP